MIYEKDYITEQGHHCLFTCISNYSRYAGKKLSEIDLFLKVRGYDIQKNKFGMYSYNVIGDSVIENVQIPYEMFRFTENHNLWKELSNLVKAEKKVIVFVEAAKLKYSSAFAYAAHIGHCVNVIGVNDKEQVYISDGYIATTKGTSFEGWISFEELLEAWKGTHYSCAVIFPERVTDEWYEFNKESQIVFANQIDNNKKVLDNIRMFISRLKMTKNKEQLQEGLQFFNNSLRMSGLLFVRDYFLEIMKQKSCDSELIEQYVTLLKQWNIVSCQIIKLQYVYDENMFDVIYKKIEDILSGENNIYKKII